MNALDNQNKRKIKTIRNVSITYQDLHIAQDQTLVKVSEVDKKHPGLLQVEIAIRLLAPFLVNKQLVATVRLNAQNMPESLFSHGWERMDAKDAVLTKRFGLSSKTLTRLVKSCYTRYDFIEDYLNGDTFSLSSENGYNDFLLRQEGFEAFYDRLIEDLINQKLSGEFLFSRIDEEELSHLAMIDTEDLHDKEVLKHLTQEIKNQRFTTLRKCFLSSDSTVPAVTDFFHLAASDTKAVPHATLLVSQDNHSMNEMVESLRVGPKP